MASEKQRSAFTMTGKAAALAMQVLQRHLFPPAASEYMKAEQYDFHTFFLL
jgi:hypothetical protein